jgi:putative aminophosphonate oxidoreductase
MTFSPLNLCDHGIARRDGQYSAIMRSFWLQQALADEGETEVTPLSGDLTTDVCIVGGGFTGLWTALRLKALEPALDVTIIEGDICGGGASGRNGGFCMTWMSKAPTMLKLCGAQDGARLLRASEDGVREIGEFCAAHGIDSHFCHDGWLWTASNQAQMDAWTDSVEALDKVGLHPFEALSAYEVARRSGSARNIGGVFEKGIATVQPAALARGLRRVALDQGIRIHEQTPMTGLQRTSKPAVETAAGTVRATTVVLALNAWAHELPEFRRTVLPIAADGLATEPVPERLAEIGLEDAMAISDSRMLVNYYRTTRDGRMVWGKGGGAFPFAGRLGDRFNDISPRGNVVQAEMARFYPALADAPIAATWRGPATRTATGLPFFGRMAGCPGIVYGHGYTGNGVGPSYLGGRILASLALGLKDEWSDNGLARGPHGSLPPEPIRYIGGRLVQAAASRVDRAEDDNRAPSWLDTKLAGLAPAGLAGGKKK